MVILQFGNNCLTSKVSLSKNLKEMLCVSSHFILSKSQGKEEKSIIPLIARVYCVLVSVFSTHFTDRVSLFYLKELRRQLSAKKMKN